VGDGGVKIEETARGSVRTLDRLRRLFGGVGWEFQPDSVTNDALKHLHVQHLRLINVDPDFSHIEDLAAGVLDTRRLDLGLRSCASIGAIPHVILGVTLPEPLARLRSDARGQPSSQQAGADAERFWKAYSRYLETVLTHILVTKGFRTIELEVGNEPEIAGTLTLRPPFARKGSEQLYDEYLQLFRVARRTVDRVRLRFRGKEITLGGPASAWPYSFYFGDFNWTTRFLEDCSRERLRLDFISLHFYGDISSIAGAGFRPYPSFIDMLRTTQAIRDRFQPRVPIQFTEWGLVGSIQGNPKARLNSSSAASAWAAKFLDTQLRAGVEGPDFYLTTTNKPRPNQTASPDWGWPSLYLSPVFAPDLVELPMAALFEFVATMSGKCASIETRDDDIGGWLAFRNDRPAISVILWNCGSRYLDAFLGGDSDRDVSLRITGLPKFGNGAAVITVSRIAAFHVSDTPSESHIPNRSPIVKEIYRTVIRHRTMETSFQMSPYSVLMLTATQ